jgi:hypothetical protein
VYYLMTKHMGDSVQPAGVLLRMYNEGILFALHRHGRAIEHQNP